MTFLAANAVMGIGAVVQGALGFGMNVIAAPLLLLIDPRFLPGPAIAGALFLTILVAIREHLHVDFRGVKWALVGRVPGTALGAWALTAIPETLLGVVLAAVILVGVGVSVFGRRLRATPKTLLGAGFASGVMGTVSSIGGPPMALVYQDAPGSTIRATLSAYFVIGTPITVAFLAVAGHFGPDESITSLALVPGIALGFAFSRPAIRVLDRGYTRPALLVLSGASAVAALIRYALT